MRRENNNMTRLFERVMKESARFVGGRKLSHSNFEKTISNLAVKTGKAISVLASIGDFDQDVVIICTPTEFNEDGYDFEIKFTGDPDSSVVNPPDIMDTIYTFVDENGEDDRNINQKYIEVDPDSWFKVEYALDA